MSGAVRTAGTRRWTAPGLCGVHVGRSPLAAPGEQGRDRPMVAPAWISTADSGGADSEPGDEGLLGTEGPGARQVARSAVLGRGQASVAVTGDCY